MDGEPSVGGAFVSVLLIAGIVTVVWLGACLLVVALCVSAKQGDGEDAALAPLAVPEPRRSRSRRSRRSAPALS